MHTNIRRTWFRLDRHDDPPPDPAPAGGRPADDKLPQFTGDFDPERAARALASAREGEKTAKAQAQEALTKAQTTESQLAAVLKALGKTPDGSDVPPDPEAAVAELTDRATRAEAYAWTLGVKSNVYDLAEAAGANAKLVYNSSEFRDLLDDLVDDDPGTSEFRTALEQKMRDFVAANPEYAVTPGGRSGPRPDPGQGGRPPVVTDFTNADHATFAAEARKYGIRPRSFG